MPTHQHCLALTAEYGTWSNITVVPILFVYNGACKINPTCKDYSIRDCKRNLFSFAIPHFKLTILIVN